MKVKDLNLKTLRTSENATQRDVAEKLKVYQSEISAIERRDLKVMTVGKLIDYLEALGYDLIIKKD